MRLRDYRPDDRAACLAVFASNVPTFFAAHEEADFARFLDRLPGPYLVLEGADGAVIGCGGHAVRPETGLATLCWGMVRRDAHRRGLGRYLLLARLAAIARVSEAKVVRVNTSQHSAGFFARLGLSLTLVQPDGHVPGIDLHRLELALDDERRAALLAAWEEMDEKRP
jgi:hypothetical protein